MIKEDSITFVERAEYHDVKTLRDRTVDNAFFASLREALFAPGPHLLYGPRGVGKTHQMRLVHEACIDDPEKPAAIYCSLARYSRLEPFLRRFMEGFEFFETWMIAKLALAGGTFLVTIGEDEASVEAEIASIIGFTCDHLRWYVTRLETRKWDTKPNVLERLTVDHLNNWFDRLLERSGRERLIVLFDDAALPASVEYSQRFFQLFYGIQARMVAPKAAIYSSTMPFVPREAGDWWPSRIDAWLAVDDPAYGTTMDQLLRAWKLDPYPYPEGVVDLLKYAAFGNPRAFLSMASSFRKNNGATPQEGVERVIDEQLDLITAERESLPYKLPDYTNIATAGDRFFKRTIKAVAAENRALRDTPYRRFVVTLFAKGRKPAHGDMVQMLMDSGLLHQVPLVVPDFFPPEVHYFVHPGALIRAGAFQTGPHFQASAQAASMSREESPERPIINVGRVVSSNTLLVYLEPCTRCATPRTSPPAFACGICGRLYARGSRFERCLKLPVAVLAIGRHEKEVLTSAGFRTLGDIIPNESSHPDSEDPVLTITEENRPIVEMAQQYVDDYLS